MRYPVLAVLTACSVPATALEGKDCTTKGECADGYLCDKTTNRCFLSNGDGGIVDSRLTTSCLGTAPGIEIYRYNDDFMNWIDPDGTWMGGPEIKQTSSQAQNSYAFRSSAQLMDTKDYRVTATMRIVQQGSGSPSYGIVLRAQLSSQDKSRYACIWIPKGKELRLEGTSGGNTTTLSSALVSTTIPEMPLTMEAQVVGSVLSCCIREFAPSAKLTGIMNPDVVSGFPGLQTTRMQAAFGSFTVTAP
jgi:hypothetical protein